MMIGELRPRSSEVWQRDDAEPVVIGCDRRLGVTLYIYNNLFDENGKPLEDENGNILKDARFQPSADTEVPWSFTPGDYLLRPPGTCTREQCGVAKVTVESLSDGAVATAFASVDTVVVDVASLGDAPGTLKIRAELLENGRTLAMKNGQPLADELEVAVSSEECGPDGAGGAGGAGEGGAGTGGSAGSSAGTGGSAGSSAGSGGAGTGGSAGSSSGAGGAPGGAPGEGVEGGV